MKKCHAVTKEETRVHKCFMCSCVYNSSNALSKHLSVYHGLKTKDLDKTVRNHVRKSIELIDDESIHSIKGKKKLYLYLDF